MAASRVLIVDDEPSVRQALLAAMEESPLSASAVASAEEALAVLAKEHFDVLVVDKNLPGESGVDLLRKMRQEQPAIGFVMITGYASADSARASLDLAVDAYIEKPFEDVFLVCQLIAEVAERGRQRKRADVISLAVGHFSRVKEALKIQPQLEAKPLRVVLVGPPAALPQIAAKMAQLSPDCERCTDVSGLGAAMQRRPVDIVVIDETVNLTALEDLKQNSPQTAWAAMVSKDPALSLFTRLIRFGVTLIIDKMLDEKTTAEKIDRLAAIAHARKR